MNTTDLQNIIDLNQRHVGQTPPVIAQVDVGEYVSFAAEIINLRDQVDRLTDQLRVLWDAYEYQRSKAKENAQ